VVLLCSGVTMVARLNWNQWFSCAPALRASRESVEFRSSARQIAASPVVGSGGDGGCGEGY